MKTFKKLAVSTDYDDLRTVLNISNKLGMPVNGILDGPHMMKEKG